MDIALISVLQMYNESLSYTATCRTMKQNYDNKQENRKCIHCESNGIAWKVRID